MPEQIHLTFNGEAVAVDAGCRLDQLLQQRGLEPKAQATAVNGEFVARAWRANHTLKDGDAVLCFQPIVGG
jgi:sulfur carrier protein